MSTIQDLEAYSWPALEVIGYAGMPGGIAALALDEQCEHVVLDVDVGEDAKRTACERFALPDPSWGTPMWVHLTVGNAAWPKLRTVWRVFLMPGPPHMLINSIEVLQGGVVLGEYCMQCRRFTMSWSLPLYDNRSLTTLYSSSAACVQHALMDPRVQDAIVIRAIEREGRAVVQAKELPQSPVEPAEVSLARRWQDVPLSGSGGGEGVALPPPPPDGVKMRTRTREDAQHLPPRWQVSRETKKMVEQMGDLAHWHRFEMHALPADVADAVERDVFQALAAPAREVILMSERAGGFGRLQDALQLKIDWEATEMMRATEKELPVLPRAGRRVLALSLLVHPHEDPRRRTLWSSFIALEDVDLRNGLHVPMHYARATNTLPPGLIKDHHPPKEMSKRLRESKFSVEYCEGRTTYTPPVRLLEEPLQRLTKLFGDASRALIRGLNNKDVQRAIVEAYEHGMPEHGTACR